MKSIEAKREKMNGIKKVKLRNYRQMFNKEKTIHHSNVAKAKNVMKIILKLIMLMIIN